MNIIKKRYCLDEIEFLKPPKLRAIKRRVIYSCVLTAGAVSLLIIIFIGVLEEFEVKVVAAIAALFIGTMLRNPINQIFEKRDRLEDANAVALLIKTQIDSLAEPPDPEMENDIKENCDLAKKLLTSG